MAIIYILTLVVLLAVNTLADVIFEITNRKPGTIWAGIQGNPGHPHLNGGGFALNPGETKSVSAPDDWAGRFWARTWCDANTQHCLTGDCGNKLECNGAGGNPPATLLEITLKGSGGMDFYDISLVDGFNVRASIKPEGGSGGNGQYECTEAGCMEDVNANCPGELQVKQDGTVIACNSACNQFKTDEYCCAGAHNTPETCKSSDWPVDYPAYFKKECPDAYSYAYDDHKSTFTCKSDRYTIVFGAS